jgi:ABC-2 type transport system ATP-binding protein
MAVIDVRGIGKRYKQPGRGWVAVLRDVDLQMEAGTVLGLLGPNGAGKTTLIKILAGLLRPDAGGGTVLGFDLLRQHDEVRARVSLVAPTADVGIDNNLTVQQNLAFWAPIYGLYGARARSRIDDLLERLGLADKTDAWPMHISAGQRQRLALARSLLAETPLLFLDEPTNKLDLEGVRSVRQMIAELNREHGVTILLTTHVMEEAEELCSEIALLREGQLIAHQPTGALTRSLRLARPITVTLRQGEQLPARWETEVGALPGVTSVAGSVMDGQGAAASGLMLRVESLDLRASTPALLSWVRAYHLTLISMRAEPVTLTDVFTALADRRVHAAGDAGDRR